MPEYRARIAEKFQVRTHEQRVALASQLALWPAANSQDLKTIGGREHRRRAIRPTAIAKALRIARASVYRALA
jgi:hypothetical protein